MTPSLKAARRLQVVSGWVCLKMGVLSETGLRAPSNLLPAHKGFLLTSEVLDPSRWPMADDMCHRRATNREFCWFLRAPTSFFWAKHRRVQWRSSRRKLEGITTLTPKTLFLIDVIPQTKQQTNRYSQIGRTANKFGSRRKGCNNRNPKSACCKAHGALRKPCMVHGKPWTLRAPFFQGMCRKQCLVYAVRVAL